MPAHRSRRTGSRETSTGPAHFDSPAIALEGEGGGEVVLAGFERRNRRIVELDDLSSELVGELGLFFDLRSELAELGHCGLFRLCRLCKDRQGQRDSDDQYGKTRVFGFHFA